MNKIFEIIQIIILSIVIIFLTHYFFVFLKSNLTLPKLKDLLDNPRERYNNIYQIIDEKNKFLDEPNEKNHMTENTTSINDLPEQTMKNELKSFLHQQLKE